MQINQIPIVKAGNTCIYAYIYVLLTWIECIGAKNPKIPRWQANPQEPVVIAHEITYNLSILSLEQLQKSTRSHEAVACFVCLSSDLTWDNVFAKLKIKISDVLFPRQVVVGADAFEIFFQFLDLYLPPFHL